MQAREIAEDRTLDYKRELGLESAVTLSRAGRLAFLIDVTAMANAEGGSILYGADEGEGLARGRICSLPGMAVEPDGIRLTLAQLLRDLVDERLDGVESHAVSVSEGRYCLVVRVPASPLAPHMVNLRTEGPRFYSRGTVNNEPMDTRQIKEVALRAQTAIDRARARLLEREQPLARIIERRPLQSDGQRMDALSIHLLPLTSGRPPDLSRQALLDYMSRLVPWDDTSEGSGHRRRISLDGVASETMRHDDMSFRWTLLLRGGGVEFVALDRSFGDEPIQFDGQGIEREVVNALSQARTLLADGFVSLPAMLALRMDHVRGRQLVPTGIRYRGSAGTFEQSPLVIEPEVVARWEDLPISLSSMLNVLWQSAGFDRSPYNTVADARQLGRI
jgi:hypothetical protein